VLKKDFFVLFCVFCGKMFWYFTVTQLPHKAPAERHINRFLFPGVPQASCLRLRLSSSWKLELLFPAKRHIVPGIQAAKTRKKKFCTPLFPKT
jgi:hypothetical protein